jgi:hypothetical protein
MNKKISLYILDPLCPEMPYVRRYRRRRTIRRKPRRGVKSIPKRARYRKSARAQSRQIATTARSVMRLRKRVLEDATAISRWQINLSNIPLDGDAGLGLSNNKNIFVFPLTSCTSTADNAAQSSFDPAPSTRYPTWNQVQPAIGDTGTNTSNKTAPAFIRLYTQKTRMCFHQNNMNRSCRYDLFVVRLARNDETQSDHNMQMVQNNIDGVTFAGCPSTNTRFNPGEDFYSAQGWYGPNPSGGQNAGVTVTNGYDLVKMNNQRYKVEHHRQFVLGRTVNPAGGPSPLQNTPAAATTVHARDYYETSFTTNYGGTKVMAVDMDGVQANAANITINDIKYSELDRKIKRWIVIFPSRVNHTGQGTQGVPVVSLISDITCRVPV